MNSLYNNCKRSGKRALAFLFLTVFLASCGDDDSVVPAPTNHAPATPTIDIASGAPAHEAAGVALTVQLHWLCSDPDNDPLTYTVVFGTASNTDIVAQGQGAISYTPTGLENFTTYYWQVSASDDGGMTANSPTWSFTTVAEDVETISTPATPSGSATVEVDESTFFSTSGAVSSEGHVVQYQFNWGNGSVSAWGTGTDVSHSFSATGTYDVMVKARCSVDTDIESAWSSALTVTVQAAETVSTPNSPAGPTTGLVDATLYYDLAGAVSNLGHAVEYQVVWGDGSISTWTVATPRYHSWATSGTYEVVIQARCIDHPEVESAWSTPTTLVISLPAEQITVPGLGTHDEVGGVGDLLEFSAYGGISNLDHPTELQFDWGDGTYSDWGPKDGLHYIRSHAWEAVGTYQISARARCIEHSEYVSDWMDSQPVEIMDSETVSAPSLTLEGEVTWNVGRYGGGIYARLSESSVGHDVEYQFDVNGTLADWVDASNPYLYTLPTDVPIDYYIKAHARCVEHTEVVSDWSATTLIHVVAE